VRSRPKTSSVIRTMRNTRIAHDSYHASRNPTLDYGVVPAFGGGRLAVKQIDVDTGRG
jgi:hypothetical protein